MDCTPQALMDAARCFRCIPKGMLMEVMSALACEWANSPSVITCPWYAGDGSSLESYTTYPSFTEAANSGQSELIWGDLNSYWNDDGLGTYVKFYLAAGWRATVVIAGSNIPVYQAGPFASLAEDLEDFLHSGFVPVAFCLQPDDCFWFAADGAVALTVAEYLPYTSLAAAQAAAAGGGWSSPNYVWGSVNNWWNLSGPQQFVSIMFNVTGYDVDIRDAAGVSLYSASNLPSVADSITDLEASGFLPPEFCVDNPTGLAIPDGSGGFWNLVVDTLGNVGAYSVSGPATPDIILSDGSGGFWQVKVDNTGLRYADSHAGPATTAPTFMDTDGVFWTLIVDTLGNLGATS